MLQMGFHHAPKDETARFNSIHVPPQRSRAPLQGKGLASTMWNHPNFPQSSSIGTSTIHHHDVVIHASRLPPPRSHGSTIMSHSVTPENSFPRHTAEVQDHLLKLKSMPFDEWSLGSQASGRDCCLVKKSSMVSPSASSSGVIPSETGRVDYHSQSDEHWMEKYQELQAFFRFHGHSNVPSIFPENQALANWVKRTRGHYKLFHQTYQSGHSGSTLTKERAELLSRVDFQTNLRALSWQQQYEKLVAFQEKHGHIRVTLRDGPSLCNWIKRQRKHCRDYYVNGKGFITAERFQKLHFVDSGFAGTKILHGTETNPDRPRAGSHDELW